MPDPDDPRAELPESDIRGPDFSGPGRGNPPTGDTGGEPVGSSVTDDAHQGDNDDAVMGWPTRDPEQERPGDGVREWGSGVSQGGERAASGGSRTPAARRPEPTQQESTQQESTQQIRRVEPDPPRRSDVDSDTDRISRDDGHTSWLGGPLDTTDPGCSRAFPTTHTNPGPRDRGSRDQDRFEQGPPTTRIGPLPEGPDSVGVDRPTQQFSLPGLNHPQPDPPPSRGVHGRDSHDEGPLERTDPAHPASFTTPPDTRVHPGDRAHVGRQPGPGTGPGDGRPAGSPPDDAPPGEAAESWQGAGDPPDDEHPVPDVTGNRPSRRAAKRGLLVAGALLVVVVLGGGVALGWPGLVGDGEQPVAEPPAPVRLRSHIPPVDGTAPVPTTAALRSALAPAVANPALGTFGGVVVDAATGRTLWKQAAGTPLVPASTAKLLTTSAALLAVDHDFRFTTKVVRGSRPGTVVLVGGGDPTLSAVPEGQPTVYPGAARLEELVAEVERATNRPVTSVKVDVGRYSGPELAPGWLTADVANGYVAPIRPVMLSGGRADPAEDVSPRSSTPALDAGRELASRLGVPESAVSLGDVSADAPVLGAVRSATLRRMVHTTLLHSDNVLAEALARQVAVATGHEPSFEGAARAVRDVLSRGGFDLGGTSVVDGSGLSVLDRVTPNVLGELLRAAAAPLPETGSGDGADSGPRVTTVKMRPLLRALPVAGGTGSLAERYQAAASEAQGWVRAKTGTLTDVNSLAGTVVTSDGRLLAFAFMSNGSPAGVARPALDKVAAALRSCGCR